jgi:hypothetical protein
MIGSMSTAYAYTTNIGGDVTSGDGATRTVWPLTIDDLHKTYRRGAVANDGISKPTSGRIGPYDLVANPGAARQLCSYYLE